MKRIKTNGILTLLLMLLASISYALPTPKGIDGIIYELDGITQVRRGVEFYVHNLNNNHIIYGKTGYGSNGRYSVSIKGDDGSTILIKAWNKYNQVNTTLTLSGVMRNVKLLLNTTYPPIAPNITSQPITNAIEDVLYTYQIQVFDENQDLLQYSLITAPLSMSINTSTGLISWLPLNQHVGGHNVTIQVSDGIFLENQSFTIQVQNVNDKPSIISIPITNATQDVSYFYDIDAVDEDNDVLNYSLLLKPSGMIINTSTGLINWTPDNSQVGLNQVIVEVTDSILKDNQSFNVSVANVNDLPVITSLPVTKGKQDELYNYNTDAYDIDNDILTYSLINSPKGMKINKSNGNITWLPTNDEVGTYNITVSVSDDKGSVLQPFALVIENVNDMPVINSSPITQAEIGRTYTYDVDAYDIDKDALLYSLIVSPSPMSINRNTGLIEWVPKGMHRGNNTLIMQVSDGNLTSTQQFYIWVSGISITRPSDSGGGWHSTIIKEIRQGKIPVIEAKTSLDAIIKVEELTEKPSGIESVQKRVYKYLKIETTEALDNVVINFSVDHSWIEDNEIKPEDIVLTRYTPDGWKELLTRNVSKDDKYFYYDALTQRFSFFAITVREGVVIKHIIKPEVSKVSLPYRITGTIYNFPGFSQVKQGTRFWIENLNTSEIFIGETGVGPNRGGYIALLHGNEGDAIRIRMAIGKEFLIKLKDIDDLNLMLNFGAGFTQIGKYELYLIFKDPTFLFLFVSFISLILIVIAILIKIRHNKKHQK